jgi:hypothetical protein
MRQSCLRSIEEVEVVQGWLSRHNLVVIEGISANRTEHRAMIARLAKSRLIAGLLKNFLSATLLGRSSHVRVYNNGLIAVTILS